MATRVAGDKEGDGGKSNDDDTPISLAMATAKRVAGDEESVGRKSDGDDKKGCRRATATARKRAMAAATRAAGDEEGDGEGGESDGDAYKEGDGKEEGECKGGESDGNGEEDGEGDKGDGDGDKEGDSEEEGEGNCNSVFGAQNKCVSQRKKAFPYLGRRKSQITNLRLRLTNANEIWECSSVRNQQGDRRHDNGSGDEWQDDAANYRYFILMRLAED